MEENYKTKIVLLSRYFHQFLKEQKKILNQQFRLIFQIRFFYHKNFKIL